MEVADLFSVAGLEGSMNPRFKDKLILPARPYKAEKDV